MYNPLRSWFLFGWLPFFWFWPLTIGVSEVKPESTFARRAGAGASFAYVFFFIFLFLALFDPVGAGFLFFIFMYFFLFVIVGIWISGCGYICCFNKEAAAKKDKKDKEVEEVEEDELKKMPTKASTNLKSLKMQL